MVTRKRQIVPARASLSTTSTDRAGHPDEGRGCSPATTTHALSPSQSAPWHQLPHRYPGHEAAAPGGAKGGSLVGTATAVDDAAPSNQQAAAPMTKSGSTRRRRSFRCPTSMPICARTCAIMGMSMPQSSTPSYQTSALRMVSAAPVTQSTGGSRGATRGAGGAAADADGSSDQLGAEARTEPAHACVPPVGSARQRRTTPVSECTYRNAITTSSAATVGRVSWR
jgi:hypothetical protein